MNLLPAILIGGPPHAGKSVLAYGLSQTLRQRAIEHYVLRAYPDGEGDWANQAEPDLVRAIRVKGYGSPEWVAHIARDIARRQLPLLVDPGGKPTAEQATLFDQCTHAILLCPDEPSHAAWLAQVQRHGLTLLADFRSVLMGESMLEADDPIILRGVITGLDRHTAPHGIAFDALVARVAALFAYSHAELRAQHLANAPAEIVLELTRLGKTLNALDANGHWVPAALPRVLDYLPMARPLALYDRAPVWLYAALALLAQPQPIYQFDARLGWVHPPILRLGEVTAASPFQARVYPRSNHTRIEFALREPYLDYAEAEALSIPVMPAHQGIVVSGKLPLWLWTGITVAYQSAEWLGIYQPQLGADAIVVHSRQPDLVPGQRVSSVPS